jgi:hypothetical protein
MGCNCVKAISNDAIIIDYDSRSNRYNRKASSINRPNKVTSDEDSNNRTALRVDSPLFRKIKTEYDVDSFARAMISEFNMVRVKPKTYIYKIKTFYPFIKQDVRTNRKYFDIPNITKINLIKGKEAFDHTINYLKNINNLDYLELRQDLSFPFPADTSLCTNRDYITSNFLQMNKRFSDKYHIKGFHYDLNINNPEFSTLMQIVDDTNSNGQRRSQILDKDIKYVGINLGRVKDNLYCIYIVFAS